VHSKWVTDPKTSFSNSQKAKEEPPRSARLPPRRGPLVSLPASLHAPPAPLPADELAGEEGAAAIELAGEEGVGQIRPERAGKLGRPHGGASARRCAGDLRPAAARASTWGSAAAAPPRRDPAGRGLPARAAEAAPGAVPAVRTRPPPRLVVVVRGSTSPSVAAPPRRLGPPLPAQEDCVVGKRRRIFAFRLSSYPKWVFSLHTPLETIFFLPKIMCATQNVFEFCFGCSVGDSLT